MYHYARVSRVLAVLTMLTACTTRIVMQESTPAPVESERSNSARSTAATLGVPPGHLPPPGQCRVWVRGTPPGHQPRSRSCDGIDATAPAGSMILYRPSRDRKHVEAWYVDRKRPGVIVRVELFDAETGRAANQE